MSRWSAARRDVCYTSMAAAKAAGGGIGPPAEAAWLLLYTMRFEIGLVTKSIAATDGRGRQRQLEPWTDTHTQDNYSNPRCACAPRVNKEIAPVVRLGSKVTASA